MKTELLKKGIILMVAVFTLTGCTGEEEVKEQKVIVEEVDEDEILKERAEMYYDGLTADSKNIMKPSILKNLIDSGSEDIYIYDIRSDEKFEEGHIEGAKHKFWFEGDEMLGTLPKDKTIVVVCNSGQSAGQTVGVLRMMGFDATALYGGMNNGWYPADLPVVK